MKLKPDEQIHVVSVRKPFDNVMLVLPDTLMRSLLPPVYSVPLLRLLRV
jgi:hypothetical protein